MGFETKQISKDVEFTFNPGVALLKDAEQTIEAALKPTILKVPIESNVDKDTLERHMLTLVEAARITKAVNFRSIDLNNNPIGQIANIFKQANAIAEKLDFKGQEELKEFLNNIETGFSEKIPGKDPNKPYGRNYIERPKVKHNIDNVNNNQAKKS